MVDLLNVRIWGEPEVVGRPECVLSPSSSGRANSRCSNRPGEHTMTLETKINVTHAIPESSYKFEPALPIYFAAFNDSKVVS